MQATNKSDATQVYEGAERATRVGIKDFFKYILKRIFISPSRLKAIYPELNSKKYLFLYYYIKRFFDKGIHGAKKIADEAKQIKQIKNKDIEEK